MVLSSRDREAQREVDRAPEDGIPREDTAVEPTGLICFLAYPALIVVVAVIASQWRYYLQVCPGLIENWAMQNGFRDVDFQWTGLRPFTTTAVGESPFSSWPGAASDLLIVYRINAVDSTGRRRTGRALCRGWLWSVWMSPKDPIIQWDPDPPPPPPPLPSPPQKPARSLLWDPELDG